MATIKLQVRRDLSSNWTAANPEMLPGEIGFETDTGKLKIGKTVGNLWNDLEYINAGSSNISDISGLQTALNGKASSSHTHYLTDLNLTGNAQPNKFINGDGIWTQVDTAMISNRFGRLVTNATATGAVTLDTSVGDFFVLTLTGNVTLTVSNLSVIPTSFTIRIIQGGSGGYTVTWPASFKFPENTAPTLGVAVGDIEWFSCEYVSAGRVEVFKADGPFKA